MTYKQNEKTILQINFVVVVSFVVFCFTAGLKSSLNFLIEINKQQTANQRGHQFSWFIFLKKRRQTTSLLP